jgi:hypothetical protein
MPHPLGPPAFGRVTTSNILCIEVAARRSLLISSLALPPKGLRSLEPMLETECNAPASQGRLVFASRFPRRIVYEVLQYILYGAGEAEHQNDLLSSDLRLVNGVVNSNPDGPCPYGTSLDLDPAPETFRALVSPLINRINQPRGCVRRRPHEPTVGSTLADFDRPIGLRSR